MHGSNVKKFGIDGSSLCVLCGEEDGAEHWIAKCRGEGPIKNRKQTEDDIQCRLADISDSPAERRFGDFLARLVEGGPDSHMHRMGMYRLEGVQAIFKHLGITELTDMEIAGYKGIALDLTEIWVEGVLRDYVHKRSGGRKQVEEVKSSVRGTTKRQRKKAARAKRRKEAMKRKDKEAALKRGRLEHYYSMEKASY